MRLKLHFCGAELSGIKIVWVGDTGAMCGCGEESEDQEDGCCHNHHENLKVDSHQNDALKYSAKATVLTSMFVPTIEFVAISNTPIYLESAQSRPPPDIVQQHIISTSVLLI